MKMLRKLLWPLSWCYALAVWLRNKFYDWGWLGSTAFEVPILCVGNLSVGGSGKTPMVEWLLRKYQGRKRAAVLSRGYRRNSTGYILAESGMGAAELGDEPAQLARKFPEVPIAVDADRRNGIRRLVEEVHPELIILDDGFQHRRVRPKGAILLTQWDALYPDQGYLPSGDLRDHKSQARRADLIIVTKCPEKPDAATRERITARLQPTPGQRVLFATLEYSLPRHSSGRPAGWEDLKASTFTLVTGVARPEALTTYLHSLGLQFSHRGFPDHHRFSDREIGELKASGRLLTTEKDAERLRGHLDDYYTIGVAHRFGREDRRVLEDYLTNF